MPSTKIINILRDDRFEDIMDLFNKTPAKEVILVFPKKANNAFSKEDHFSKLAKIAEEKEKAILILSTNPDVRSMALKYNFGFLTSEKSSSRALTQVKKKKEVEENNQPIELPSIDLAVKTEEEHIELAEETIAEPIKASNEEPDELTAYEEPELEQAEEQKSDGEDNLNDTNEDEGANEDEFEEPAEKEGQEPEESQWETDRGAPASYQTYDSLPQVELAAAKMTDIVESPREEEIVKLGLQKKKDKPIELEVKKPEKKPMDDIDEVWRAKTRSQAKQAYVKQKLPRLQLFNFGRKTLTFMGTGVVVLFAVILYISTGNAEIIIKPRINNLDLNLKVNVSDKFSDINSDLRQIPGQLFSVEKKVEETFSATGERDVAQKARGKITVYNAYGTTPQILIATTRFESEGGLIFRSLKTATIPGTTVKNGQITPGSAEIEVIADKAGSDYNISPGKFTIPAFKEKGDLDRFQKFYGVSDNSFKGGIVGKSKIVTERDYIKAREAVTQKLSSEVEKDLASQAAGFKILTVSEAKTKESSSSAQPDEATENFTVHQTTEMQAMGFKEANLYELISQYVGDLNKLMILPDKLSLEYRDVSFNAENKTLIFTVSVKGPAYTPLNKEKIISDLIGKDEDKIKDYIKNIEGISSAKVILSPFWVRKVPANREKIKFEIQYE